MDTRRVFHGIFSYIPQARALPQAWLVTDPAEAWFVCIERRKQASQDILELKGEETCPEQTLQLQCRAQRHQIYDQAADEKTRTFFSRGFYKPNPGDEFLVVEDCERCMGQTAWWVIFMTFPMNKTGLLLWIFGEGPRPEKRQTGQRKIVCWDFSGGKYTPQIIALGSGVPLEGTIFFFFQYCTWLRSKLHRGLCTARSLWCLFSLLVISRFLYLSPGIPCHLCHGCPKDDTGAKFTVKKTSHHVRTPLTSCPSHANFLSLAPY